MKIVPSLEEVQRYAASGEYRVLPLSCEMLSDRLTPIECLRILKSVSTHCYLLESAEDRERWGRYTFLGFDPVLDITCLDGEMKAGSVWMHTDDPSAVMRQILSDYKSPSLPGLPPFTGGLVGYFAYDYLSYSEPSVKMDVEDSEHFQDVDVMLFDKVIAFDHFRQKIVLIVNMRLEDGDTGYSKAVLELKQLRELLLSGERREEPGGHMTGPVEQLFDEAQYCDMVERAKHHIREGDIFQIVLSNRLSAPFEGSLLNAYRILRTINPSPYMFYFSGTDVEVAGASPETLVKLKDGVLHTFPLAGTRPRGKTEAEDQALEAELLSDEKELAEHNMLVDLGRNDLGRISRFGTVEVEKLHSIERFSHVMHIGSTVRGEIKERKGVRAKRRGDRGGFGAGKGIPGVHQQGQSGSQRTDPRRGGGRMILLIDNYDSFSYNLYQLVGDLNPDIRVVRNDELSVSEIVALNPERVIISPGPGRPEDAGNIVEVARELTGRFPILGVCLGHQAICAAFGATVTYARQLMHGKQSDAKLDLNCPLFAGLPEVVPVARYHSLAADPDTLPECLEVTAMTPEGEVMAVQHTQYHTFGVQFHPESILTPDGKQMLRNFIEL